MAQPGSSDCSRALQAASRQPDVDESHGITADRHRSTDHDPSGRAVRTRAHVSAWQRRAIGDVRLTRQNAQTATDQATRALRTAKFQISSDTSI